MLLFIGDRGQEKGIGCNERESLFLRKHIPCIFRNMFLYGKSLRSEREDRRLFVHGKGIVPCIFLLLCGNRSCIIKIKSTSPSLH